MYTKLGYAILAEKELTDTIEWLMVVDRPLLRRCRQAKQAGGGRFPAGDAPRCHRNATRRWSKMSANSSANICADGQTSPVTDGDMANLFLLMNLCPADDFRVKLVPWGVQLGPEMERCYLVGVRPAMADRDRLEVASLALRDRHGSIMAVCRRPAGVSVQPKRDADRLLLSAAIPGRQSPGRGRAGRGGARARSKNRRERPSPCRLLFSGVDQEKIALFEQLGFSPTDNTHPYFTAEGQPLFEAREWEKTF